VAVHVEAGEQPPALDRQLFPSPKTGGVLVERASSPEPFAIPFIDLQRCRATVKKQGTGIGNRTTPNRGVHPRNLGAPSIERFLARWWDPTHHAG